MILDAKCCAAEVDKLHHGASLVSCLVERWPSHGLCRSASTTRENAAEDCRRLG